MAHENGSDPATKADVESVRGELKAELRAVHAELKAVETRLDRKIDKVAAAVVKTQQELGEIRRNMATREDVSRILEAIDTFAAKAVTYDQKAVTHGGILVDHTATLADHGRRLDVLESKS